ncbi:hypothetical protein T459_16337 [Capsicum annuum]|uniref:Peptide N-acetyl-beta-D-glucosaminyl asparaginase amidase A N-terminal domain-containing protein n=1 Tax=Capsicum annuum TaxID=4072 RepID=A0A2G2Z8T9_CAPAN|nr:hypothetical protein T459_16337 [Capsicum annuum]
MKIDVEFMIVKKFGVDFDYGVDLIVSISRNVDLNDDLWFGIENAIDVKSKDFKIPQNVYRALLKVYVSFHENDDSWYGNSVNEYISLNNLSVPRNGAFREVIVSLDEMVVCVVWPFTMIYIEGDDKLVLDWMPLLSS